MISVEISILSILILTVNTCALFFSLEPKYPVWKIITVFALLLLPLLLLNIFFPQIAAALQMIAPGITYLIPIFIMFKGKVWQKIFIFYFALTVSTLLGCIVSMTVQIFFEYGSLSYRICLITAALLVYISYSIIILRYAKLFFQKLFAYANQSIGYLYILMPASSYYLLKLFFTSTMGLPKEMAVTPLDYFLLLFILGSLLMMCFFIISTNERITASYELKFSKDMLSAGADYYKKLSELSQSIRIMKHDYRHHLNLLQELYKSGAQQEFTEYLAMTNEQYEDTPLLFFCENQIINAYIHGFYERCLRHGIAFHHRLELPDGLSINNYELCMLIGNLLENAFEACLKLPQTQKKKVRQITFEVSIKNNQLLMQVKNSFDGIVTEVAGNLQSTKMDGGLGIKSICAVAEKHHGEMLTDWDDTEFCSYVVLQLR